ncbi:LysM peptidoglycan-binding domain-containing protein [Neptunicella marina]|uniref:LysM peptidoglycan-binding domain-containing protein n=1 Tax=Neptunicella marina TaxID=2125989 RepID=A0A8J6IVT2_9ALTE|nr:LysM peptidoglycan-binding domain-containing protein [Neptunicella marina]MBC3766662.1 LysM peptidoglycan-binding domain-containing protein [Neptunicella marina]
MFLRDLGLKSTCLGLMLVLTTACVSTGGDSSSSTSSKTNSTKIYKAQPGLSARERFVKALEHLENGEEGQAKAEINAYLLAVPKSTRARILLDQIEQDISNYFPKESFDVKLTSGESLSTLAKKYLGSPLKFYALAKYNDIDNASKVNIGQTIRIPKTSQAIEVKDGISSVKVRKPKPFTDVVKQTEKVNKDKPIANTTESDLNTAEINSELLNPADEIANELSEEDVIDKINQALDSRNFDVAYDLLNQLKEFGSLTLITRPLAVQTLEGKADKDKETNPVTAANLLTEAGELNSVDNKSLAAFKDYRTAHNLDADNLQATEQYAMLQKQLADKYHREASSAFRRQELDDAIEKWNIVLDVDPNHPSAKLYREQALELKARLEKIKN